MARPDYEVAREKAGFSWSAGSSQGALREVSGIAIRDFNLDPSACIEAYRKGRPILCEMFEGQVSLPAPATPAISYGHVNCLGSELLFPEGGEVAHTHVYGSLQEGIEALKESVDFATAGMAPFYLSFLEKMREALVGEQVGFGFGEEGPITTAYELRGDGFFMEVMDTPELVREFLTAMVRSILDFHRFASAVRGVPAVNPTAGGMADDISSFIPPHLFPDVVLPAWEQYYSGITTGTRHAHVEDLRPQQLRFLEDIGLERYDPSISPRLNPQIIARECRVPFVWRLGSFHYTEMTCRDVVDFVFQSAADGACGVTTNVAEGMCSAETVPKVLAFVRAAREAKEMVERGASSEELRERVSPEGREKLWERWCGYLSPLSSRGGARPG